jgi:hypothetical protein
MGAALAKPVQRPASHETEWSPAPVVTHAARGAPADRETATAAVRSIDLTRVPTGSDPLPAAVRSTVRRTTGHEPDDHVRVHTDAASRSATDALGARAMTVGGGIHLGSRSSLADTALLVHEGVHAIQQRGAPAGSASLVAPSVVHRDEVEAARAVVAARAGLVAPVRAGRSAHGVHFALIDDVRDKLSYGFLDWAITDSEAMEALGLLGTVAPAALPAQLSLLGDKYVQRLFDNLPDAAKTGPLYQQVVQAASSSAVADQAEDLLSYGLFDWAVTDTEVTEVFNSLVNRSAAQQEQLLADLHAKRKLGRLIANSNAGHHALFIRPWIATLRPSAGNLTNRQAEILRTIVQEDIPRETMELAASIRFDMIVGPTTLPSRTPATWTTASLRRTYLALELLPAAHVARNQQLLRLGQFDKAAEGNTMVAGVYNKGRKELAINKRSEDVQPSALHEVGHAVDAELGWAKSPEPALPARGGWFDYDVDHLACATDMLADSNGPVTTQLNAAQRGDVTGAMTTAMGNRSAAALEGSIKALAWFPALPAPRRTAVLGDRALAALPIGLNKPWFNAPDGGEHLGAHVYEESYPSQWARYEHAARARMLTQYQFRDPGEWFAEAYAWYYEPDARGKGAKLNDKDPSTKTYFDTTVDTLPTSR